MIDIPCNRQQPRDGSKPLPGSPARTDDKCFRINRKVKLFRDRGQFELKIVRHIIPNPGAFEKALELTKTRRTSTNW
jgi:hypothetical protein